MSRSWWRRGTGDAARCGFAGDAAVGERMLWWLGGCRKGRVWRGTGGEGAAYTGGSVHGLSCRERVGYVGYGGGLEVDLDRGAGEDETFFGLDAGPFEASAVRGFCVMIGVDLLGLGCAGLPVNRGNLLLGGGVLELFKDLALCSGSLNLVASRSGLASITFPFACRLLYF